MGVMSENIHQRSMSITQHLHTWLLIDQCVKSNWMVSCKYGLYLVLSPDGFSFLNKYTAMKWKYCTFHIANLSERGANGKGPF